MICAALKADNAAQFLECVNQVKEKAVLAEVRLDHFEDPYSLDLAELVNSSPLPLIFTNRHPLEGGCIQQDEEKRIELLKRAVDAGAAYVDIELESDKILKEKLLLHARKKACKVIVSWHDFQHTPGHKDLVKIVSEIGKNSPDVAKIVTTATEKGDVERLLALYYANLKQNMHLVAFCMGHIGKISRVACLALGAPFTFASCWEEGATAPGQLSVDKLYDILRTLDMVRG